MSTSLLKCLNNFNILGRKLQICGALHLQCTPKITEGRRARRMTFIGADNRFQTQGSVCCCGCAVAAAACGQLKLGVKLAQSTIGRIHCIDGRTLDAASARVLLYNELQYRIEERQ